jgi:hypothetical protein
MARTGLSPIEAAGVLHANLCAGRPLVAVAPPVAGLLPAPGEWALGVLGRSTGVHLDYARHCAADVVTYSTGPAVVFGSPQFLAGYALGTVVQRGRLHRKARRLAEPQWRLYGPLVCTVVTNRRLWCQVAGQWVNFDHDTITGFDLTNTTLTLSFAEASPLRISGPWALWISVAVAHLRYGPNVAARIPALAAL